MHMNSVRRSFALKPIPPFRLDLTVWALRRRPDNVVDRWDGHTYRRVLPLPAGPMEVAVTQTGPPETPRLRVAVGDAALSREVKQIVTASLERLLGFRTDMAAFYPLASCDAALGPLAQRFRGMKPPRFATVRRADLLSPTAGPTGGRRIAPTDGPRQPHRYKVSAGDHPDETRIHGWRSCGVGLGSRPRPRNDQEEGHLGHPVQGLHGPGLEKGAAVFDQERHDRPLGHAQRISDQEAQ